LELSANSFFASDHHHHNPSSTDRLQQLPSPAARDLSSILWPAISGFVGTEATSEMIGVFVVSEPFPFFVSALLSSSHR
jgi:hypothetical protein